MEHSHTLHCRMSSMLPVEGVVAPMQLETHPELVRFDVDFDLPEAYLRNFHHHYF